jgi:hypothetical protein
MTARSRLRPRFRNGHSGRRKRYRLCRPGHGHGQQSRRANGTITAISDTGAAAAQTITYTASAGYAGADSFVYSMTDGVSTDTATVTITVQPPQANDDAVSIANGTATSINVLANDQGFADPATVTITGGPSHGTATVSGSPGNKSAIRINYTPTTGYAGTDSISYQVDDGFNSDSATVSITVLSYKANNDKLVLQRDNCCQYLYVARNDVGFGSQVTITLIQSPDHEGYAYVSNSTGTKDNVYIYYYPRPYNYPNDYTETLRYQITDGTRTDTATVSIEVVRYKAVDDQTVTGAGTPVSIGVSTNDIGFGYNKTRRHLHRCPERQPGHQQQWQFFADHCLLTRAGLHRYRHLRVRHR